MSYELYFSDTKVGTIEYLESDFPSLYGQIIFDEKYLISNEPEISRVKQYLKLQAESCRFLDIEHEQTVETELEKINSKLDEYMDLIETDEWYLVDIDRRKHCILSPIIRLDNEVTWRWNITA